MKIKFPILLFIFGLFLFLLPSLAEAACGLSCEDGGEGGICCWGPPYPTDPPNPLQRAGVERIGTIMNIPKCQYILGTEYCSRSNGKCKESVFPSGSDGQICVAHDQAWDWGACNDCTKSGNWDYSESQCIQCSGKIESKYLGNTTEIYNNPCENPPAGNGKCESACGANTACDEVSDGNQCTVGKYCEALGRNCLSGDTCSGCVCVSGAKPTIAFSPSSFTFTAVQGGSNPATQTLEIWNSGVSGTTLNWSVSDNATWLTLSPTSGSSTGEHDNITLSVNISGMSAGSHSATITISDPNATNSPRTASVSLTITAPNLKISDIEDFDTDKKVYYTIYNQGNATTGTGFNCSLYVGGTYKTYQYFSNPLGAGVYRDGVFSGWTCTPGQTYSIEVCADDKNGASLIAESNENDNCRTESLTCPSECTGSINVTPATDTEPCDYTISIYNVDYCQGLTWQVTRDGSSIGSGTVTGDTDWSRTIYDNGLGADSSIYYRLYIDGDLKDYDSVSCQEAGCECSSWVNQSCGYSDCDNYHLARTRTCPNDCDIELECLCDESCCSAWSNQGCGPTGGCAETEMSQTRNCGDCPYLESRCVSDPSCGAVGINPPQVTTLGATNITQTSAALNGDLLSLGYDPGTCPDCQCIVWFEWGTSGTAGASGSYGNSTTPKPMTAASSFTEVISGLSPGITYYFEAFAENGGSW